MKKIFLTFSALGVIQAYAVSLLETCTVTVPGACVEIVGSHFDLREDYHEGHPDFSASILDESYKDHSHISFIVQIQCLVNSDENPSVMVPPEYKVFLAVHTFADTEEDTENANFLPTDMIPDQINFEISPFEDVTKASLTCS